MIKAIIFDLDDTLFPEREYVLSGFQAVDDSISANCSVPGFFEKAVIFFNEGKRGNIFNLVLDDLGISYDETFISKMINIYREHKPRISLYDDAAWAMSYFRGKKQLGIITDGYLVAQKSKIDALQISFSLDAIIYSDEFGRNNWKPSLTPYLKMMEALGRKGEECVYIADNPIKDFIAAKNLEWQTIQIYRELGEYPHHAHDKEYEAGIKISSLFELQKILTP